MQMQYQQLDLAVKEKLDNFFTAPQDIRKEMVVKRAEQRAFLRSDDPNSEAVGKLARNGTTKSPILCEPTGEELQC